MQSNRATHSARSVAKQDFSQCFEQQAAHDTVNDLKKKFDRMINGSGKSRVAEQIASAMAPWFCEIAQNYPYNEREDIRAECRLALAMFLCGRWSCETKGRTEPTDFYSLLYHKCQKQAGAWMDNRSVYARRNCPGSSEDKYVQSILPLSLDQIAVRNSTTGHTSLVDRVPDENNDQHAREVEMTVDKVVSSRPQVEQAVFYLRSEEGVEFRDIASRTGVPKSTACRMYQEMCQRLRYALYPGLCARPI